MLRNQFHISTWLLFGAGIQSLLLLLSSRSLFLGLPPLILLLVKVAYLILECFGLRSNAYMSGVVPGKVAAQIPDPNGEFSEEPSNEKVVVMLLGAKSNHPLGYLAPEFKKMGDFNQRMSKELNNNASGNGFLGQTTYLSASDRSTAPELLYLSYWRSIAHLHRFAHSPLHREAWTWWNETFPRHSYLGIYHEIFEVDRKHWESIYIGFQRTGLGATTTFLKNSGAGESKGLEDRKVSGEWVCGLIQAGRSKLKTSAGRLGWSEGTEHDSYTPEPYNEREVGV